MTSGIGQSQSYIENTDQKTNVSCNDDQSVTITNNEKQTVSINDSIALVSVPIRYNNNTIEVTNDNQLTNKKYVDTQD